MSRATHEPSTRGAFPTNGTDATPTNATNAADTRNAPAELEDGPPREPDAGADATAARRVEPPEAEPLEPGESTHGTHAASRALRGTREATDDLLLGSCVEFVSSLREPLHAITLESDLLAASALGAALGSLAHIGPSPAAGHRSAARAEPRASGGPNAGSSDPDRVRFRRLQRQIASLSRAITLLERALHDDRGGERYGAQEVCDLVNVTTDAVGFLRPFSRRYDRRLAMLEPVARMAPIAVPQQLAWKTLVVVCAERLIAMPARETLRVSIRSDRDALDRGTEHDSATGLARHTVILSGPFEDRARQEDSASPGIARLLDRDGLMRSGVSVDIRSADEIAVSFAAVESGWHQPPVSRSVSPEVEEPSLAPSRSSSSSR